MTTKHKVYSLRPSPSFWEGMARALDLSGTLQIGDDPALHEATDAVAMFSDWLATGDDLRSAIGIYGKRIGQH